jgi:hypothetical protein
MNTAITSTTNSIKVVFNDDVSITGIAKGTWAKIAVTAIKLNSTHITIETQDAIGRWIIDYQANSISAIIVDSVNGVAPSSLSDLYDKLTALVA